MYFREESRSFERKGHFVSYYQLYPHSGLGTSGMFDLQCSTVCKFVDVSYESRNCSCSRNLESPISPGKQYFKATSGPDFYIS